MKYERLTYFNVLKKVTKATIKGFLFGIASIVLICFILIAAFVLNYKNYFYFANEYSKLKIEKINETTFNKKTNDYINIEEIKKEILDLYVYSIDRNFYTNKGYSLTESIKLFVNYAFNNQNYTKKDYTITEKLSESLMNEEKDYFIKEVSKIFMSIQLEKKYSKDDILEFYLNNAYYGNEIYGIKSASLYYFDKDVNDLTLNEIVFLTTITKDTNLYNPITSLDLFQNEFEKGLHDLYFYEKISIDEYKNALNTKTKFGAKKVISKDINNDYLIFEFDIENFDKYIENKDLLLFKGIVKNVESNYISIELENQSDNDMLIKCFLDEENIEYLECVGVDEQISFIGNLTSYNKKSITFKSCSFYSYDISNCD